MRIVTSVIVVCAAAASAYADGQLCVFPAAKPLTECFKGNSISEDAVRACEERTAAMKPVPPRVRVDDGPWVTFAPDHWRCVAVPVGKRFRFQVENHGRSWFVDRTTLDPACKSARLDLFGPNFYGAMWATCSKRTATTTDEPVR